MKTRIQKFLAERGAGSRREIEEMIKNKKIKVNNKLGELGMKVDKNDRIEIDNKLIEMDSEKKIYIMFNKPRGVVSTCKKSKEEGQTVLDYVTVKERIYPIGRLDKDSEGLLLLTNDGDLALKLTHPRYEHEKEYLVKIKKLEIKKLRNRGTNIANIDIVNMVNTIVNNVNNYNFDELKNRQIDSGKIRGKKRVGTEYRLTNNILNKLRNGVDIGGYITRKSTVCALTKNSFLITLREGKNRQIRRMCEKVGLRVVELKRVRIGGLELGDLKTGEWRHIIKFT